MINFRYHLVSIAAILLALAAGIALGSGPLDNAKNDDIASGEVADPAVAAFDSAYVAGTSAGLLKDKLQGQSVVVVTLPGARSAEIKSISDNAVAAGAELTGQLALTSKLIDPGNRQFAEGVAQQAAGKLPEVASATEGFASVGAALGYAIVAKKTGPVTGDAATVSSAFSEGGLIEYTRKPEKLATLAIVVAGPGKGSIEGAADVIAQIGGSLSTVGAGVVLAGPSSSSLDDGIMARVRNSDSAAKFATVDVVDSPAGRVAVILALSKAAAGQPGSWGTSRSIDGGMPR